MNPKEFAKDIVVLVVCLVLLGFIASPAVSLIKAQAETDTLRDMLTLVKEKQPDSQVTLLIKDPKGYDPYGKISHIGDDYVCVMRDFQNGTQTYNLEACVLLTRLVSVELQPGIHR